MLIVAILAAMVGAVFGFIAGNALARAAEDGRARQVRLCPHCGSDVAICGERLCRRSKVMLLSGPTGPELQALRDTFRRRYQGPMC